jgi:hypothetical protein
MGLSETLLFYLVIGLAVAAAVWMANSNRQQERLFRTITAVLFWPLYLPILLSRQQAEAPQPAYPISSSPADELSEMIAEVERELDVVFSGLDGWAEEVLSRERERIDELRTAWNAQAARIREIDAILAKSPQAEPAAGNRAAPTDAAERSARARRENFLRLQQVRTMAHQDLTTTLARVRELVSLIHLAKYTGAPASRAEQLVVEIAASVEGLSEVATWREESAEGNETCEV